MITKPMLIPMDWEGNDVFDVVDKNHERIGQIAGSHDGWAAYLPTATGAIRQQRIGTFPTVKAATDKIEEGD